MSAHKGYAVDLSHETAMYASDSFVTYQEAVAYLDEVVDSWENEMGVKADRSIASSDNMYAARCGNRAAQVVRDDMEVIGNVLQDKRQCGEVFHEFDEGAKVCRCGRDEWQEDHLDDEEPTK